MKMMVTAAAVCCMLVVGSLTDTATAKDATDYNGGSCQQLAQTHDPAEIFVGRFAAEGDGTGPGAETSAVACFTDQRDCMRWVQRDSGGTWGTIYQMSCHRGL